MHARASQRRSVNTLSILSTYRTCSQRVSLEPDKSFRMVPELLSVLGRALKLSQEGRLCVCCRDGGGVLEPPLPLLQLCFDLFYILDFSEI